MKKINVNKASQSELESISGIGIVKAKAIIDFREKGGTFDSIGEFIKIVNLQPHFLNAAKDLITFTDDEDVEADKYAKVSRRDDLDSIIGSIPGQSSYYFDVIAVFGQPGQTTNAPSGYRLEVEYSLLFADTQKRKKYVKSYDILPDGTAHVSIRPSVAAYVLDTMLFTVKAPDGKWCYRNTHVIDDEGNTIEIGIPVQQQSILLLSFNNLQARSYHGYKVRITITYNRGQSGIVTEVDIFDFPLHGTLQHRCNQYGEILETQIEVYSNYGEKLCSEKKRWEDLQEKEGIHLLHLEMPTISTTSIEVKLVEGDEDSVNPYLNHTAVFSYDIVAFNIDEVLTRVETFHEIDRDGKTSLSYQHYTAVRNMKLEVKAPGGEILGHRNLTYNELEKNLFKVEVKIKPRPESVIENEIRLPKRPIKTVGRVLETTGSTKFANVQVILYTTKSEDTASGNFSPLIVTSTDNEGYFVIDTPKDCFTAAYAKIGIPKKGNQNGIVYETPVKLQEDIVIIKLNDQVTNEIRLFFPEQLILVIDIDVSWLEDQEQDVCALGFQKHKKVLDEFSFYSVVRTTEPLIQGYTLEEDGDMSIQEIIDVIPLESESHDGERFISEQIKQRRINKTILNKYLNQKRGLTTTTLLKAFNESNAHNLREIIRPPKKIKAVGRAVLDLDNAIDWDEDPTIYQATTLAHGHLLHFKQEWVSDGYSLGDLLYSLPLAPGQKKQVVVFDWERRDAAARQEQLDYHESLYNSLSRDRDLNEIVSGVITENINGNSTASTGSVAGGLGISGIFKGISGILGISGGSSSSSSHAWQNSTRNTSMNDLQTLRDRTVQSANAVRGQRATVIQTASQGERFSVETEVVANYNHCHSLTIQYFEVLRHMKIQQRLSSVQECLFVPLIMSSFDYQKILRWREPLESYVFNRNLHKGFDAIERIENDYEGSDFPEDSYAAEIISHIEGQLYIKIEIPVPADIDSSVETELKTTLGRYSFLYPGITSHYDLILKNEKLRNEIFLEKIAPQLAYALVDKLTFYAYLKYNDSYKELKRIALDATLVSDFNNGKSHYIRLNNNGIPNFSRKSLEAIYIEKTGSTLLSNGKTLAECLPPNTRVIVQSADLSYTTPHYKGTLFRQAGLNDDLTGYTDGEAADYSHARLSTPLKPAELRNPKNEDLELANTLHDHLNDNLEYYHKVIWMNMSPERRFMFLDGIQVTDYSEPAYTKGVIRSVASVVENRIIGIVGNSLVMPVASGFKLDPNVKGKDIDLIALYQPTTPIEPINISLPTKGVFAEAVMGKCNSCEKIEENRFWRWSQEPIPDSPTAISQINTDSRYQQPPSTEVEPLPSPVVNIQNIPTAPDPTGITTAANMLQNSSFKDITGLEQNQKNAIDGLKASLETASQFGSEANDLMALNLTLDAIDKAQRRGILDEEKAKEQAGKTLENYNNGTSDETRALIEDYKAINQALKNKEITPAQAELTTNKIGLADSSDRGVLDSPEIKAKVNSAKSLTYTNKDETLSLDGAESEEEEPAVSLEDLKVSVNFRRPEIFYNENGPHDNSKCGYFGFDWLRDEYIYPIEDVLIADGNEGYTLDCRPLCKDVNKLKQEYIHADPDPIRPNGMDYYPAWLSIWPPETDDFPLGSVMHSRGIPLSLEIFSWQELPQLPPDIEIEFSVNEAAKDILTIEPKSLKLSEIIQRSLYSSRNISPLNAPVSTWRDSYRIKDIVTVKCEGVLTEHTPITAVIKKDGKSKPVGRLMVYANHQIPLAQIAYIKVSYSRDDNVDLESNYEYNLIRRSFNQALIYAKIVHRERFIINDFSSNTDVQEFLNTFSQGKEHDPEDFMTALKDLYQNYGNYPDDIPKHTLLFVTDEEAIKTGGIAEGAKNEVENVYHWGDMVIVFGSNLSDDKTHIHEIGHSLSLPHTFEPVTTPGVNSKHQFYQGTTDNFMDYSEMEDDNTANPNKVLGYFFKWQWDIMRTDKSLKY